MNQNKNINIDGNITHKIKRSLELAPEIIKLESKKRINIADHCYGCTAGAGSSCGGSLL